MQKNASIITMFTDNRWSCLIHKNKRKMNNQTPRLLVLDPLKKMSSEHYFLTNSEHGWKPKNTIKMERILNSMGIMWKTEKKRYKISQ